MRIALVIERFDAARGGRERSTAQIAAGLARRGHAVAVLCQHGTGGGEGVEVRQLGCEGWGRAGKLKRFVSAVRAERKREKFDIVHATLPVPGANVYQPRGGLVGAQAAASVRRRKGLLKLVFTVAEPANLLRRQMRALERRVVRDPGVLCLAVSDMVRREFLHYHARGEGVRVIFNGVDDCAWGDAEQRAALRREVRRKLDVADDAPVFLTAAKRFTLKGVAETIEAFARYVHGEGGDKRARLVAVGQGQVRAYERLARRRGVRGQVVFAGEAEDIGAWLAGADACVLLSWYDPCSRVVLEAVRSGVPAITTAFNGACEVLARGAGVVIDSPDNIAAAAAALRKLADPDCRAGAAAACCELIDALSMDRHVDELVKAYEEVVGNK
jgi:UDP-glucose:(heptosyl)LPS alpha-1,3-glucosyltransferase